MERAGPSGSLEVFRLPKTLLEDWDPELDAPVRGPLFPRSIFRAPLVVFGLSAMLTMDWVGRLLLNSEGVVLSIGPLNGLRVPAVLMAGIASPSMLLTIHYSRIHSYISDESIFFAITFSLSFMLGFPCGLVAKLRLILQLRTVDETVVSSRNRSSLYRSFSASFGLPRAGLWLRLFRLFRGA
jgi:hypothetical protein